MTYEAKAASFAARSRQLSESLWTVNKRAEAVEWCAAADMLLAEVARFLEQDNVRGALAKVAS